MSATQSSPRPSVLWNGTRVELVNEVYGTTHVGTLIHDDTKMAKARTETYDLWTIVLDNGNRFRNEGYLRRA